MTEATWTPEMEAEARECVEHCMTPHPDLLTSALAEIERLRTEGKFVVERWQIECDGLQAEIERLRHALEVQREVTKLLRGVR